MAEAPQRLKRRLGLLDLIVYGLVIIQPTAPMPIYGVVSQIAHGQVTATILLGMVAMLFTAVSYGRMARLYPAAGSAYTYVRETVHPAAGFMVGWSVMLDYLLNPLICTLWCSKALGNFFPSVPFSVFVLFFVLLFTGLNLGGIEASAKISLWLAVLLTAIVFLFIAAALLYARRHALNASAWIAPLYRRDTFSLGAISSGTAVAVLTYIGFDAVSTLGEETVDPKRNIMRATVLTCVLTGLLASLQVYFAGLVWPDWMHYPDVDTAFVWIGRRAGGVPMYVVMNTTILIATIGSGFASQLAAARLLYGMGRDGVLPGMFARLSPRAVPRNNVLLVGCVALCGALLITYGMGAELLNFGAFIAFAGVNLAALLHAYRAERMQSLQWLAPLLGCVVSAYLWAHLSRMALTAGVVWLIAGAVYGGWRGVFRRTDEYRLAQHHG